MRSLAVIFAILTAAATPVGRAQTSTNPFESRAELSCRNRIDELVFQNLQRLGIEPARLCSDAVFLRRVYLDAIGTLPTPREARHFLQDRNPEKRRRLVERLLQREEFADYWAMKWCDLLRVKAEFPINLWPNAVQAYHRWLRTSVGENTPYDRFVREILTAGGSNFRVPQVNFYRAVQNRSPSAIAEAVALTFLGVRPEKWPPERLANMAAFFSYVGYKNTAEWKEEIVYFDALEMAAQKDLGAALLPDGTSVRLSPDKDPREVFVDWLLAPENPWFARNIVNRIWYWLLGRGIVHEPDDHRPDNPARIPELLAYLERELLAAQFDLRHIFRLILDSTTYQLSSIPGSDNPQAEANFAHYPLRRLDAEVLIDALCQITATTEEYSSLIPEPFTFVPKDQRSISLADASTTSPFLEMFGRPARDTGLESERNNRPTAAQRLHLLNSSHIRRKIEGSPQLRRLIRTSRDPLETVHTLYLAILSRFPTEEELETVQAHAQSGAVDGREVLVDLTWALVNSAEFLYRH